MFLVKSKKNSSNPIILALDGITDPHNVGAIIRSAEAFDCKGIIIPQRRSAGLTAAKVNQIVKSNPDEFSSENALKESLGHTKVEVLVGSLFGPCVALPGIFFIGSSLHLLQMLGLVSV